MGTIASQITSLIIVYSTVYSGADQRKHQSSVSLAFAWGIHRKPVNSPHKWPVTRKMFPFDDVIMGCQFPFQKYDKPVGYETLRDCNHLPIFQCRTGIKSVSREEIGTERLSARLGSEWDCSPLYSALSIYRSHFSLKNSWRHPISHPWGRGMECSTWV